MSGAMVTRKRNKDCVVSFRPPEQEGSDGNWYNIGFPNVHPIDYHYTGIQITESEGHGKSRNGKYHEGGPFFTVRIEPDIPSRHAHGKFTNSGYPARFSGNIVCAGIPSDLGGFSLPSPDSSYLDPVGATAISIVDPTNPNANFGVALGEILHDRKLPIPAIQAWKRRTEVAKAAGSEYLNAVFGWLPLVGDMKDTAQSVKDGNAIMKYYHDNSGSNIHREFEFEPEESVEVSVLKGGRSADYHPGLSVGPDFNQNNQEVTKTRRSSTRRWFSGTFTYQAGGGSSLGRCLGIGSDADKLFGVALSPELVWELTPWSWAIDWFSNAGDVISNVSHLTLAGLVMRYGYIMEETSIVDTYSMPSTGLTGVLGTVPPATITYTVKRRREANPFGFGLQWEGLSPTQLAITAALGITRLR